MSRSSTSGRRGGFTLIEMLLVVAIIVILISMLQPSLHFAITKAKQDQCRANLNHIYSATTDYTLEHNRKWPGARKWVDGWWWYDLPKLRTGSLYEYMGRDEEAYKCPVFQSTKPHWDPSFSGREAAWTYSLNEYLGNSWQGQPGVRTATNVQHPAELLLYTDENPWSIPGVSPYTINNGALGVGQLGNISSLVDALGSFHDPPGGDLNDGHSNVMFVDGHIELIHISQTKIVATPERYRYLWGWTEGAPP